MTTYLTYRIDNENETITLSPFMNPVEAAEYLEGAGATELVFRLVADEGKVLTNGTDYTTAIDITDVSEISLWVEIDEPEPESGSDGT